MPCSIGPALADAVRISFDDASADWFPPVAPSVDALSPTEAARAGCDGNAPWQVLDHLRIGFEIWAEFLATGRFEPARFGGGTEWRPIEAPSPDDWQRLRSRARDAEAAFRLVLAGLDDEKLLEADAALGGTTRLALVLSTLSHLAFHAGELATLTNEARQAAQDQATGEPARTGVR
ncbi:MAG: DinB family protein [Chloroflexi bacterium]|nr:DinB family protein [Chloroflexota bacterium]